MSPAIRLAAPYSPPSSGNLRPSEDPAARKGKCDARAVSNTTFTWKISQQMRREVGAGFPRASLHLAVGNLGQMISLPSAPLALSTDSRKLGAAVNTLKWLWIFLFWNYFLWIHSRQGAD